MINEVCGYCSMKSSTPQFVEMHDKFYLCPKCGAKRPRMKQLDEFLIFNVFIYGSPVIAVAVIIICIIMKEYTDKLI